MKGNRIAYIDGIRGMAALIVVLYHYLLSFYPELFPFNPNYIHTDNSLQDAFIYSPLNIFFNSGFAVCLFFVISGYALSYKYFITKDRQYLRESVIRRYFRLEIPILFSVVVSYILLKTECYSNLYTATTYTKSTFWFSHLWNMSPDFFKMLKEGLYSSLFLGGTSSYNPVLWTMLIEFLGSMLVFATLALFGDSSKRYLVYLLLIVILHTNCLPAFIIGLALCDYYHSKERNNFPISITALIFALAIYVGSYQKIGASGIWNILDIISNADKSFPFIIGAVLFVVAVINGKWLERFFSSPLLQFLGKISFSMYLIHLLIIGSLACSLFSWFYAIMHLSYGVSFMITFFISLSFTIGASFLMYKYIDKNGIKFSKWIYTRFFTLKTKEEGK